MDRGPNGLRRLGLQGRAGPGQETDGASRSRLRLPGHEPSSSTLQTLTQLNEGSGSVTAARVALTQDLNSLILKQSVYSPERFSGITLQEKTKELLAQDAKGRNEARLNRLLLADAYPQELAFQDGVFGVTNQFAATLASVGFICFLLGRVTGAALLRQVSAHKMLGLYSVINAVLCLLVFLKLGWLSVVCVFLCYFFMSITFPTIFALGIFGLGARAKRASAYIVMGIVGGALLPQAHGGRCRSLRHVARIHRAADLLRVHRPLRLRLAQAQPGGSAARRGHLRRALNPFR